MSESVLSRTRAVSTESGTTCGVASTSEEGMAIKA